MEGNVLEDDVCRDLLKFFGARVDSICVKEGAGHHQPNIEVSFTLYDFLSLVLVVERSTVFIALSEIAAVIPLGSCEVRTDTKSGHLAKIEPALLLNVDKEIRLRIPDKYLAAKGWAEPVHL
jgi:hypothetical protein